MCGAIVSTSGVGFNSRAREGRDCKRKRDRARPHEVSIHAPARGATSRDLQGDPVLVFQFTRPRGARPSGASTQAWRRCFNSRAREGRDRSTPTLSCAMVRFNSRAREGRDQVRQQEVSGAGVSIHAPARGATLKPREAEYNGMFQFTRPRGARPFRRASGSRSTKFQFTRPRGARRRMRRTCSISTGFNSRAREGRDFRERGRHALEAVSIHAPARGATGGHVRLQVRVQFQFTRPRGARPSARTSPPPHRGFNSRAREGRDADAKTHLVLAKFQFTRPRGARPKRK